MGKDCQVSVLDRGQTCCHVNFKDFYDEKGSGTCLFQYMMR